MGSSWPNPNDEELARAQLDHKSLEEERPPERRPGDNHILFGVMAGVSIGTVIGLNMGNPFLFTPVGFISGGILGAVIGSLIKNLIAKRTNNS